MRVDELTGGALAGLGRKREALAAYERALTTRERVLGPDHPDLLYSLNNLALTLVDVGEYARARETFLQAIELSTRHRDRDPSLAAMLRFNLGFMLLDVGEPEAALRMFEDALAMQRGVLDLAIAVPNVTAETGDATAHARIGWLRSVYNIFQAFAIGSFVDELASAKNADVRDI